MKIGIEPCALEYGPVKALERVSLYEGAGFDAIWSFDHLLPLHHTNGHASSSVVMMEAYLNRTKKVRCVLGVISALGLRHQPVDLALYAAQMACLHPGRVALCVGAGEPLNEQAATGSFPDRRERVERMEDALDLIRRSWTSEDYFEFKGKRLNSFFFLYDKPPSPIPLYCAAGGPVMASIAGRFCDGFIGVTAPARFKETLIPAFRRGLKSVQKDPGEEEVIACIDVSYNPDSEKALRAARYYGGVLLEDTYHQLPDPRLIEKNAMAVKDQDLKKLFVIATTPDEIISKFEEYVKAGVNHLVWCEISPDPMLGVRISGEVTEYLKEQYRD